MSPDPPCPPEKPSRWFLTLLLGSLISLTIVITLTQTLRVIEMASFLDGIEAHLTRHDQHGEAVDRDFAERVKVQDEMFQQNVRILENQAKILRLLEPDGKPGGTSRNVP